MKTQFLICSLLVLWVSCQSNPMRDMTSGFTNMRLTAGQLINNCAYFTSVTVESIPVTVAAHATGHRYFKNGQPKYVPMESLQANRFTKRTRQLKFIHQGDLNNRVMETAYVNLGVKEGDWVKTSTVLVEVECMVSKVPQNFMLAIKYLQSPTYIPIPSNVAVRDPSVEEKSRVINDIENLALMELAKQVASRPALGSILPDTRSLHSLGGSYKGFVKSFQSLYPDLQFDEIVAETVESSQLMSTLRELTLNMVTDGGKLNRMIEVIQANPKCSIMHVPNGSTLLLLSASQVSSSVFILEQTIIRVQGQLPLGAFASSVGSWSIEAPGTGGRFPASQILRVFPALR